MPERSGVVSKIEQQPGKRPWKATVGKRVVNFWPTEFESDKLSDVHEILKRAFENGEAVEVLGQEKEVSNPAGEMVISFLAQSARLAPDKMEGSQPVSQNGSHAPAEEKRFVGRDPGMADFWLATRWAWSLAAEILAKTGKEPSVGAIAELAGEVFQGSYAAALGHKEWASSLEEEA